MIKNHYIEELSADLITRLPELEWKLSQLSSSLINQALPNNLFRTQDLTALSCIKELKADLQALRKQKHERSATYLAEHLKQKISVLVGLCKMQQKNKSESKITSFSLTMLSTRQQWLQSLDQEVGILKKQRDALNKRLEQMQSSKEQTALLNLKFELGELEKKLTLAEEALSKACQK